MALANKLAFKVDKIISILNTLYPNPPVPLNFTSPFQCLVAVVLSAQTTDGKVNEVTKELFRVAPTPELMSKMKPEEVEKIIKTVGLAPSKSRYVVNLSNDLIKKFSGEVPGNYKDLESLPGVGHKTASCVMNHIFNEPSIAVDTHVHRCALRWGLTKEASNASKVQEDLYKAFPQKHWANLNLQIIYYGREYCTAKNHVPSECPICFHISPKEMAREMAPGDGDGDGGGEAEGNEPERSRKSQQSIVKHKNISSGPNPNPAPITVPNVNPHVSASVPLLNLSPFSPKKVGKGIITYGDRTVELSPSPALPTLPITLAAEAIVKQEKQAPRVYSEAGTEMKTARKRKTASTATTTVRKRGDRVSTPPPVPSVSLVEPTAVAAATEMAESKSAILPLSPSHLGQPVSAAAVAAASPRRSKYFPETKADPSAKVDTITCTSAMKMRSTRSKRPKA